MFVTNFVYIHLLFFSVVRSSDIPNDAYKQIQNDHRAVRKVHKYNHPREEAIPVAIVFDNIEDREGKSIDTKPGKSNQNNESEKKTTDNKSPTVIKVSSDFSVKAADVNTANVNLSRSKIITEEDLKIPVAVVYDEVPTTVRNNKKVLRRTKSRNQQGQVNRRHQQQVVENVPDRKPSKEDIKPIKENVTQHESSTPTATTTQKVQAKNDKQKVVAENLNVQQRKRERDPVVPIIQSENKVFGNSGDFHYSYEGGDGTIAFEKGELKSFEDDKAGEAVVGGFSYTDKDGQDFSLSYTADENGYRPVGAHLPTPPPIPPAIERALRYLATKTTPEPVTDSIAKDDSA